jgi:alkyl sulfatase BDS1-like metallo-beta-lactamase superfamily hydrolase
MNPTSGARNWYLSNARILEDKLDPAALTTIHGAKERISSTPTDILLNLVRFNLDPEKSGDMNMTLGIKLNDTNQGYTLQIRKAVMEFQKSFPSKFDVAIYTNTDSLKKLIAGITTLDDALNSEQVKLDGYVNNQKVCRCTRYRTEGTRTSNRRGHRIKTYNISSFPSTFISI